VVADRQDSDVGRVDAPDQGHVAEDVRVAREVDPEPVLELEHDAARLARVAAVGRARGVVGVGERDLTPSTATVPPLFGEFAELSSATPDG
jgi:hypothetical protein